MERLFAVSISTTAMVWADSPEAALNVARQEATQIISDAANGVDRRVLQDGVQASDLAKFGWTGNCIPYGGDANRRIDALFMQAAPAAVAQG